MFVWNVTLNFLSMIIAVILDFILGDPSWLPHPIIYIGKLISKIENSFRKKFKNEKLKWPGLIMVIIVCTCSFIIPFVVLKLLKINIYLYILANSLILWTTLAAKSLHKAGVDVYKPVVSKDIEKSRLMLSYIVGRDTSSLSFDEIIRGDVETIAENTSDGVIAPLLYGLIGGAPLAMLYKGVNTMDSMVGYLNEKYKYIGFFPAKIDDVFNFIPARITGVFMCLSAPFVKGNIVESFKIMIRDRKNHKSPNCAYPEGATAGALKIQLGGTNTYFGEVVVKPTIGDAKIKLEAFHIKKAIVLMYASEILLLAFAGILIII